MPKQSKPREIDAFQILSKTADKTRRKQREELLASVGVKDFFVGGGISIDTKTCRGIECRLCLKACPTNALFWKAGEVGIIEELCVFCGACVLSCIVDDCIRIWRRRTTGELERFSKPRDFTALQHGISLLKRQERITEAFPSAKEYLKRHARKKRRKKTADR